MAPLSPLTYAALATTTINLLGALFSGKSEDEKVDSRLRERALTMADFNIERAKTRAAYEDKFMPSLFENVFEYAGEQMSTPRSLLWGRGVFEPKLAQRNFEFTTPPDFAIPPVGKKEEPLPDPLVDPVHPPGPKPFEDAGLLDYLNVFKNTIPIYGGGGTGARFDFPGSVPEGLKMVQDKMLDELGPEIKEQMPYGSYEAGEYPGSPVVTNIGTEQAEGGRPYGSSIDYDRPPIISPENIDIDPNAIVAILRDQFKDNMITKNLATGPSRFPPYQRDPTDDEVWASEQQAIANNPLKEEWTNYTREFRDWLYSIFKRDEYENIGSGWVEQYDKYSDSEPSKFLESMGIKSTKLETYFPDVYDNDTRGAPSDALRETMNAYATGGSEAAERVYSFYQDRWKQTHYMGGGVEGPTTVPVRSDLDETWRQLANIDGTSKTPNDASGYDVVASMNRKPSGSSRTSDNRRRR